MSIIRSVDRKLPLPRFEPDVDRPIRLLFPGQGAYVFENSQLDEGMENNVSNAGMQLSISNVSLAALFFRALLLKQWMQ